MKSISLPQLPRFLLLLLIGLFLWFPARTQGTMDSLELRLEEAYGKDKLILLNELVARYLGEGDAKQALRYAHRAEALAENIITPDNQLITEDDLYLKPLTYLRLGQAYQQRGQYLESKNALERAQRESERFNSPQLAEEARAGLSEIDAVIAESGKKKKNFLGRAFRDITSTIEKTSDDFGIKASLKLARMYENNGNYDKAVEEYRTAINQLRDKGDWQQVEELREHLAELRETQGDLEGAVETLTEIRQEKESRADNVGAASVQERIEVISQRARATGKAWQDAGRGPQAPVTPEEAELAKAEEEVQDIRSIAEQAERTRDFRKSLDYYKQYLAMQEQLAEQKRLQELALLEKAHEIENQEREITLLKQNEEISQLQLVQNQAELKRQLAFKRNLGGGLALSAALAGALFFLYRNKKRDHQKLGVAYQELETAQNQLTTAQQRIKDLLHQQVSGAVANELLAADGENQVQRRFVCIMFLDIRDFTPFVEQLSPEDIIKYQNEVLGFMIETVTRRNGIVNQILGDGFMATFGAPVSAGNDCMEAYLAAREIIHAVNEKSDRGEIPPTRIGIGLHAGHVVAGNVGTKDRKQYSVTGNPVITAARLEQLNKEFGSTLVLSKEVYDRLPEDIREPLEFSEVTVKGRSLPVEVATV